MVALCMAGLFGGFFPATYDFINRVQLPRLDRTAFDWEYFVLKILLLPAVSVVATYFSVASGQITGWFAATYLGATFPLVIRKVMTSDGKDISLPDGA